METLANESLVQVSLYVRGDDLRQEDVSAALRMQPDQVFARGERKSTRSDIRYSTTTWISAKKSRVADMNELLLDLVSPLPTDLRIPDITGVDDAFIDVFMTRAVPADRLSDSIEWSLSAEALFATARLGLRISFSVSNVES